MIENGEEDNLVIDIMFIAGHTKESRINLKLFVKIYSLVSLPY